MNTFDEILKQLNAIRGKESPRPIVNRGKGVVSKHPLPNLSDAVFTLIKGDTGPVDLKTQAVFTWTANFDTLTEEEWIQDKLTTAGQLRHDQYNNYYQASMKYAYGALILVTFRPPEPLFL